MQIPVLSGNFSDENSDYRTSYPRNLIPVPKDQGISAGYLRPADGIIQSGTGPGVDRGGINWNGTLYRVMGTKLVSIAKDGTVTTLGDVGGTGEVTFDYSFDRLAVASGKVLYYWDGTTFTTVARQAQGDVLDVLYVEGYFMTTNGVDMWLSSLLDPTEFLTNAKGSSEADPDNIVGLHKLRNEVYCMNRYTSELFQNVGGGQNFPFERIEGAQLMRGVVGTYAACIFMEALAFVGSGRNEAPAVWIGSNGQTAKISTREVEQTLMTYTEAQLSSIVCEARVSEGHQFLYVHLPDQTMVYDGAATQVLQKPVWHILSSSIVGKARYRGQNMVWCYDRWNVGDPTSSKFGYLTNAISSHFGDVVGWEFGTQITYNESRGALFHELELVCLTGRSAFGAESTIWTSYTIDGETWSQERPRTVGKQGERNKRITWLQQGHMRNWRAQKFRGTSDAHMSIARLEAQLEPLNV